MKALFNRLPLRIKLMLIGIIPIAFLVFLSVELYMERDQKVRLFGSYIERLKQSADISNLIKHLQTERKLSFEHALKKNMAENLAKQRPLTDSIMRRMRFHETYMKDYQKYTFLENLQDVRKALDSGFMQPNIIMDYYSTSIYRLNTLNLLPTGSAVYLQPLYQELVAQKLLSEMITFLGIMSGNVYNGLYTRKYVVEMLVGSSGTYRVYKSYETEFMQKAPAHIISSYKKIQEEGALQQTNAYLDTIFRKFSIDSTYTPEQWEQLSSKGINLLTGLQERTLQDAHAAISDIYKSENRAKNRTIVLLALSLLVVAAIVFYTTRSISTTLKEIKSAAKMIARGAPAPPIDIKSHDVIGNLAASILAIDRTNKQLAMAAHAIGKGRFDVPVQPRSSEDVLGNAIVEMKTNLEKFTNELQVSNSELERFAYVASHDLQEPLRMVSSFLHLLERKLGDNLDETNKQYIHYAVDGAERMKLLIQDLLQFSRVGTSTEGIRDLDCNEIMTTVHSVLSLSIKESGATIEVKELPVIRGVQAQILQVFQNLVSNAIKYKSDRPLHIEIGCLSKGSHWEFYIADNGIGIDPKFFGKIFIIFQRLHNKAEYSGTGIGLSICKKIVEKHGGTIRVESIPGEGSTFYFTIPKNEP